MTHRMHLETVITETRNTANGEARCANFLQTIRRAHPGHAEQALIHRTLAAQAVQGRLRSSTAVQKMQNDLTVFYDSESSPFCNVSNHDGESDDDPISDDTSFFTRCQSIEAMIQEAWDDDDDDEEVIVELDENQRARLQELLVEDDSVEEQTPLQQSETDRHDSIKVLHKRRVCGQLRRHLPWYCVRQSIRRHIQDRVLKMSKLADRRDRRHQRDQRVRRLRRIRVYEITESVFRPSRTD